MSVAAAYIPFTTNPIDAVIAFSVFLLATYPGAVVWAVFGELLAGILLKPTPRRIFNIVAAVLLVLSMVPVLFL
jgi:threonine/homoserine/homoserine lactone efflux protein